MPASALIIPNRYFLKIKDPGSSEQHFKARLVMQGHKDPERHRITNEDPVLLRFSTHIIFYNYLIFFHYRLWKRDIVQA